MACVLGLVATYVFFIEYLPPFKRVHLWSDIVGYSYPLHWYAFASLKAGRIPLWDPSIYSGISFVGNVQTAMLYPPTWLLYAAAWKFPQLPFKAVEMFALAHVWISFVLAYLWLRGRAGKLAGVLGAATFAFAGQVPYQLLHLGVTCATAWLPLGLWGIDETARDRNWRHLWKVAVGSALCFLAGYPSSWIAYCAVVMAYAAAGDGRWRMALGTLGAIAASALLFMVQLLPAMQAALLVQLEPRYYPSPYSLRSLLVAHLVPNWFDFNPGHSAYFQPGCMYFYLGLPALFAIGWGVLRRRVPLQAIFTLAIAFLMANPVMPMVRAVWRIPILAGTMHPNEFYSGVSAMAALITAVSLNDFLSVKRKSVRPAVIGLGCAGLLAVSGRQVWTWSQGGYFATRGRSAVEVVGVLAMFALAMWCLRGASPGGRKVVACALLLAAFIDYKVFGAGRWFNSTEGDEDANHPAYGIGGVDDDAYRTLVQNRQYRVTTAEDAGPAATDYRYSGLSTPAGFDPLIPKQYREAVERWTPFRTNREFYVDLHNQEMLQTLGVRFVLARRGSTVQRELAGRSDFQLVGRGEVFCPVYEYRYAKEPFFSEAGGVARPTAWTPGRREFRVTSPAESRFVLVEQFYPGWSAVVDGRSVPIQRWRGAFQAIPIPAGEHGVTFNSSRSTGGLGPR